MASLPPEIIELILLARKGKRKARDEVTIELVRLAGEENREAQSEIIGLWTQPGISYLIKIMRATLENAEDCVQNVLYKLCERNFPIADERKFKSYYFRSLRNEYIDFRRKKYPEVGLEGTDPPDNREGCLPRWDEVKKRLSGFPEGRTLLYATQYSPGEAMQHFSLTRNQYNYHRKVAIGRLMDFFKAKKKGA